MPLERIVSPLPGPRGILAAAGLPYAAAAMVAFLFAASGPVAIILAVGARGGLAESDIASWIFAAFCLNSVISVAFTLAYRQPLVFLWSIPGAVLVGPALGHLAFAEVVGAFLATGVLMARVLNAGFAARNGLAAARLAAEGFEGPGAPIEGRRGFVNVFGGNADFPQLTHRLGEHWEMKQVAYKPYPSGVVLHALIDACLEHREELRTAQSIQVHLSPLAVERTDRREPLNAIEARLSAQHAVAVTLLHGEAGLAQFSDAAALDGEVRALRRRIGVAADASLDKMAARIRAEGVTVEAPESRPMDDARLEAKFLRLAGAQAARLLETIRSLDTQQRVSLP